MTVLLCFTLQLLVWHRFSLETRDILLSNNDNNAAFLLVSKKEHNKNYYYSNRVVHVGQFGLGHRLSKLSAAHHLAERLQVPILQVQWNDCATAENNSVVTTGSASDNNNMFRRLFQSCEIPIINSGSATRDNSSLSFAQQHPGKTILVRNDVHGYYAGQAYKNFQIPINDTVRSRWQEKIESDRRFFMDLRDRFIASHPSFRDFQQQHNWTNHHVIGVHIRAGNGETGHFAKAQRGTGMMLNNNNINNNTIPRVLEQLIRQLQQPIENDKTAVVSKPILVFVATDTVDWINTLQSALSWCNIPVISFPQTRVERGQGVGFSTWKDDDEHADRCMAGWIAAATDMFLLADADTLIATTRSTFTQILPLSIVLSSSRNGTFCELRPGGDDDDLLPVCFRTIDQWLFPNPDDQTSTNTNAHKVMVHLPDVPLSDRIFDDAKQFLGGTAPLSDSARLYFYGRKYNPRYRAMRPFQTSWTFQT